MENKIKKYKLYIDIEPTDFGVIGQQGVTGATSDSGDLFYKIKHYDGTLHNYAEKDFQINVPIFRSESVFEYIDIQKEDTIHVFKRQEINPFFIEYDFFDTVIRNRINKGQDLNADNIAYIRKVRPDVDIAYAALDAGFYTFRTTNQFVQNGDDAIKYWYDEQGRFEFPWYAGTVNEVTKNDLDMSSQAANTIVSKALIYPIDINN